MSSQSDIKLKYDKETREYYTIWKPVVIGMGKSRNEALEDLRMATLLGLDTSIDLTLKDTDTKKED